MAPDIDPDKLYRSLNFDLQRRIEAVGRTDGQTGKTLGSWEVRSIVVAGLCGPLALAWWLL